MGKREHGGAGRFFGILLVVLLILGLGSSVVYLVSDINHRRYRLNIVDNQLLVERGRFMPFGYEPFVPKPEALRRAYAPLQVPPDEVFGEPEVFSDRADIDRTLFSLLAGWARRGLQADDIKALELATRYIERSEMLPGLSEEQRVELRTLRADLAYRNGQYLLTEVARLLLKAKDEFGLAMKLGTSRPTNAEQWISEVGRRLGTLGSHLGLVDAPVTPKMPNTAPGTFAPGLPELPKPRGPAEEAGKVSPKSVEPADPPGKDESSPQGDEKQQKWRL